MWEQPRIKLHQPASRGLQKTNRHCYAIRSGEGGAINRKAAFASLLLILFAAGFLCLASHSGAQTKTIRIGADGTITPSTAPLFTSDGVTFTLTGNVFDQTIVVQKNNVTLDGAGFSVEGTNALRGTGVDLSGCSGVTVKNLQITSCYYGVYLHDSVGNTVSGCVVSNVPYGIMLLAASRENTLASNNITHNSYGVWASDSGGNVIIGNNFLNNLFVGVYINESTGNTVTSNSIANNGNGVYLTHADSNIYLNNFLNNSNDAFSEFSTSNWSSIQKLTYSYGGVSRESFFARALT